MGSLNIKAEKLSKKASLKTKNKPKSLGPNPKGAASTKHKKKKHKNTKKVNNEFNGINEVQAASALEQLNFFLNEFQSANGVHLSSLELESIKESCILQLSKSLDQDANSLGTHVKAAFGSLWKEVPAEGRPLAGKIDPGCPAVLIVSSSALRSMELLSFLGNDDTNILQKATAVLNICYLHVSLLMNWVNFAGGTPSRVKKLIDIEALGLSRLSVIVLDMHTDVKGYSMFMLPQIRDEFWDLHKNYFHQRLLQDDLRICLDGPIPNGYEFKGKRRKNLEE